MMVVGAFNQVQQSLRWFVDNFATIATWRATLLRVMVFRDGLSRLEAGADEEAEADAEDRITVGAHPDGLLAFKALSLALRDDRAEFDAPVVEVHRGERVLIVSQPCADKSKLLRAVAGLWTRGEGTILVPPAGEVMFMPARPYLPLTTLRAAVTYPDDAANFDDAAVHAALERVGLDHLLPRLAEHERWDKILSQDEQQSLALARLVLHAPRWVFVEDTAAAMSEEHYFILRSIFSQELAHATVIGCTGSPALAGFYTRTVNLRRRGADIGRDDAARAPRKPTAVPATIAA
jgi:putative ATP-binding cassette transporter